MIDIPCVQFEPAFPRYLVPAVHLRPPCDARPDLVTPALLLGVQGQVLHQQRTRPDETHVAHQDVPQLRQLIQARRAQEPAEPAEPDFVGQRDAMLIAGIAHRSKLVHDERFACESGPHLAKHDRRSEDRPYSHAN